MYPLKALLVATLTLLLVGCSPSTGTYDAAITEFAPRPFNVAVLTTSPADLEVANYLVTKTKAAYPLVACTIVPVAIAPESGLESKAVLQSIAVPALRTALANRSFDMIQLLPDFPAFIEVPNAYPGSSCGITTKPYWPSATFIAGNGISDRYLSDSPYDPAIGSYVMPWRGKLNSGPWNLDYLVAKLEAVDVSAAKAKIDAACAPTSGIGYVLVDAPGKSGSANNNPTGSGNTDTYWEANVYNYNARFAGQRIINDWSSYSVSRNANLSDDASDFTNPAAFQYLTTAPGAVNVLVSYGRHSNGDGKFGAAFGTPKTVYAGLTFAPRSVIIGGESFTAYGYATSGTNLGQWLELPAAAFIGNANEPCAPGYQFKLRDFYNAYCVMNATYGEAFYASCTWNRSATAPFGIVYQTIR